MRTPTSALVLATAAVACLLTSCTSSINPGGPALNVRTTTPSAAPTPSASPTQSDAVGQVAGWWTGGGKDRTTAITNDLGKITNDSTDPTTMGNDCATLSKDISAAQSYKPIPDAQAQQHWSAALDKYQQAATDCQAGTSTLSSDVITKAGNELSDGTTELNAATTRMQAIAAAG